MKARKLKRAMKRGGVAVIGPTHEPQLVVEHAPTPPNPTPPLAGPVQLTITLARSGVAVVVTTPQGHAVTVPAYGEKQLRQAMELVMHLLAAQQAAKEAEKSVTTGQAAAPLSYIIERWMAGSGKAKRVLEMGSHRTFNPDHALEMLGLGQPAAGANDLGLP